MLKVKLVVNQDGKTLAIEMESSGDSLLGFEKKPTTKFQKSVYQKVKSLWETKFMSLVQLNKGTNCRVLETSFNMEFETHEEEHDHHHHGHHHKKKKEEHHSEILAKASISCTKSLANTEAIIKLKPQFNETLKSLYLKKRSHFIKKTNLEVIPTDGKSYIKKTKDNTFKIKL